MAGNVLRVMEWPVLAEDALATALWSAAEIAAATGGTASGDFLCAHVATDSREVMDGTLFFALIGESMDGHRFVEAAYAAGAAACVVDRPVDGPHVLVADTFVALQALARAARTRSPAKVIGVTGSVGKTSVKEAIWAALDRASRGKAHRSLKSYNNHVGVPLSLARLPARDSFAVFEMGMNHAGEIAALSPQVRPHVALITTIAAAHIENLGSMEAIAAAKAEIFAGLEPGGIAIIPADSPWHGQLAAAARAGGASVISFGKAAGADVRLLDAVAAPGGGALVTIDMGDRRLCYTVAAPGEHNVINSLAVMAAVRAVGGDLGAAGLALAEMAGMAGRGLRFEIAARGGPATVIDESYNANPASMRATLASLAQTPARRRIAVLGSMKELGDFGPGLHAALAEPLVEAGVDYALLVGPEMAALAEVLGRGELGKAGPAALGTVPPFAHCPDTGAALAALQGFGLQAGDAVLVKGSNSVGLGRLVAALAKA